jgi:Tfp pilus assembly protein PilF
MRLWQLRRHILAVVLQSQGKLDDAMGLYRKALEIKSRL